MGVYYLFSSQIRHKFSKGFLTTVEVLRDSRQRVWPPPANLIISTTKQYTEITGIHERITTVNNITHPKKKTTKRRLVLPFDTIASRYNQDTLARIIHKRLRQPPASCPKCARGNTGKLSIPYYRIDKLICHDCSHVWSRKAARKAVVH